MTITVMLASSSFTNLTNMLSVISIIQYIYIYTVKPPNKRHFGDNINSNVVSFVERLFSSHIGSKSILEIYRETYIFGILTCVFCRKVYYIVSLSRRVHYRRFYCIYLFYLFLFIYFLFFI